MTGIEVRRITVREPDGMPFQVTLLHNPGARCPWAHILPDGTPHIHHDLELCLACACLAARGTTGVS